MHGMSVLTCTHGSTGFSVPGCGAPLEVHTAGHSGNGICIHRYFHIETPSSKSATQTLLFFLIVILLIIIIIVVFIIVRACASADGEAHISLRCRPRREVRVCELCHAAAPLWARLIAACIRCLYTPGSSPTLFLCGWCTCTHRMTSSPAKRLHCSWGI